eukprot:CAMPEP_0116568700 /NCGR_PEP_ID=MMETSP0397-20121206/15821_1 /TAXON_ID=216820 /ORGANISM="Cyclophora tenuis, Strain ECT3854" /LENGTH=45 /DNA_ID= /DNA_START= /DNA_END= /DNA_ORIENTATION=
MKKALVFLALAATTSTTASAFVPSTNIKTAVGGVQTAARFPLAAQ